VRFALGPSPVELTALMTNPVGAFSSLMPSFSCQSVVSTENMRPMTFSASGNFRIARFASSYRENRPAFSRVANVRIPSAFGALSQQTPMRLASLTTNDTPSDRLTIRGMYRLLRSLAPLARRCPVCFFGTAGPSRDRRQEMPWTRASMGSDCVGSKRPYRNLTEKSPACRPANEPSEPYRWRGNTGAIKAGGRVWFAELLV
jgi:hypothetical protein